MNNIKLFASDLDGTFFKDDRSFDEDMFKQILSQLKQEGKYFVVSSGRSFNGIDGTFKKFNQKNEIAYIGQNGGLVYVNGKVIFESSIDEIYIDKIYQAIPKISALPQRTAFEGRNITFIPDFIDSKLINTMIKRYSGNNLSIIHSSKDITEPIQKISLFWEKQDQKLLAQELISKTGLQGLRTTSSGYGALDIINDGISKSVGLKRLGEYLNIHGEEMAAFGDGENDLEMLYYVGYPFVMPNAPEFIKSKFNNTQIAIADNVHSGVLKTIAQIIKK
ncbi:MAG: Cof-type HAD-IIB family hydrolase [Lactobacillaceae bacterium]|jgi:Cof subfamily protein (haloacid dehalogenase superfamily)|nr:Cof-type HAD-IIB family hydrolase [Lactobacillaceae bacterium]